MWKLMLVDVNTGNTFAALKSSAVPRHAETVRHDAMSEGKLVRKWVVVRVEWDLEDEGAVVYLVPVPDEEMKTDAPRREEGSIAARMRDLLLGVTADERVAAFDALLAGYCRHCGSVEPPSCHCENDE